MSKEEAKLGIHYSFICFLFLFFTITFFVTTGKHCSFFYPGHPFIKRIKVQTYSLFSEFIGFAIAALTAWKLTVSRATARAATPASTSVPAPTDTR